ncbi:MAG: iron-only hydrogenase system regulator [Firmicutes bacterium]|nr:iron-only hydrogenase system regulator [Bacillota bacterium]
MENRVALIGIVVENFEEVGELNAILHEYADYIIGRMGLPYKKRDVSIISVAIDAPLDIINALSGKIGKLSGVTSKTVYAKLDEE